MKIASNKDRLIELFDADPRNDTAIAEQFGVSKQAVSAWRNGTRSPKKTVLIEIANYYKVSIEWLMGFDVPKHTSKIDLQAFSFPVSSSEARIISEGIDRMPKERREQALKILQVAFSEYADLFKEDDDK